MKTKLFLFLLLCSMITLTGCDPDFWTGGGVRYDKEDLKELLGPEKETEPTVKVSLKSTNSFTMNGLNVKYTIENTVLEVGDILRIILDSENEEKPLVKLILNNEEVVFTSELPAEYATVLDIEGVYEIRIEVFNQQEEYEFTIKTGVTVNK